MKVWRRFTRVLSIIRLIFITIIHKNIVLTSKLLEYNLALDTRLCTQEGGQMMLHSFSTGRNVHLSANKGSLVIGKGCRFNRNDIVVCHKKIEIGEGTIFGPNVCVYDHDHAFDKNGLIDGIFNSTPIVIGRNVWIGAGVIILRGSVIEDNCIIGAGCIVKGHITRNSIVTTTNRDLKISPLEDYDNRLKLSL